ncbi:2-hydroxyisoflavanone dehydratase-like [Pistacia vera]|uniref:2-hydroxyisoflavanone dehydratase-like n=1 Tax=Pistacia vera TaxID=55513 RepID=UPI00126326E4|nr:2-hydroxyisoflavanone dehydratase-like [Pistacia vera]XP_031284063.1 2-hydroxyisoflavanone dehydratase-like [Pistacia vera]
MGSMDKEVVSELPPFFRIYKDGSVERTRGSPIVPPSPEDPETGVSSKDITVSEKPKISARVYLPKLTQVTTQKLPVLVYYHGGAFCIESAFSLVETKLMNTLVAEAKIVAISIEYQLAPENPILGIYEDCWTALQWVCSHSPAEGGNKEPWLSTYGNFEKVFIGGDSSGGNIAHNILMRAGKESLPGGVKIYGGLLTHPYFWGSKPVGREVTENREKIVSDQVWRFLYPTAPGGIDNPMMNFNTPDAPSLAQLGCCRLLVSAAELDELWSRCVLYYNTVKESGWKGEVEFVDVEGEEHAFHILNYESENAKKMIKRLASFLIK